MDEAGTNGEAHHAKFYCATYHVFVVNIACGGPCECDRMPLPSRYAKLFLIFKHFNI